MHSVSSSTPQWCMMGFLAGLPAKPKAVWEWWFPPKIDALAWSYGISPNLHIMCIFGTERDGENFETFCWEIKKFSYTSCVLDVAHHNHVIFHATIQSPNHHATTLLYNDIHSHSCKYLEVRLKLWQQWMDRKYLSLCCSWLKSAKPSYSVFSDKPCQGKHYQNIKQKTSCGYLQRFEHIFAKRMLCPRWTIIRTIITW